MTCDNIIPMFTVAVHERINEIDRESDSKPSTRTAESPKTGPHVQGYEG